MGLKYIIIDDDSLFMWNSLYQLGIRGKGLLDDVKNPSFMDVKYELNKLFRGENKSKDYTFLININLLLSDFRRSDNVGFRICREIDKRSKAPHLVIFYTFLEKETLLASDPIVYPDLKFNQFFRLPGEKEKFSRLFESSLINVVSEQAKNLLRGWQLSGGKKSILGRMQEATEQGYKVLVIDDEYEEYKEALAILLGEDNLVTLGNIFKEKSKNNIEGIINAALSKIDENKIAFVLSDLYLYENHKVDFFSSQANVQNISGLQLFLAIRETAPSLPFVFFTTSNKVWNYQFASNNGHVSWCVKQSFEDSDLNRYKDDLLLYYKEFESNIVHALDATTFSHQELTT